LEPLKGGGGGMRIELPLQEHKRKALLITEISYAFPLADLQECFPAFMVAFNTGIGIAIVLEIQNCMLN
jgi:hypothetical protein